MYRLYQGGLMNRVFATVGPSSRGVGLLLLVVSLHCGCGSSQPCGNSDYSDAIIGVIAGEHQVAIEFDDSYGRYKATEGGCHTEVACPQYRCSYSVTTGPSQVTLYAIVDGVEQPPFEMKLRHSGCGEDTDYVEFDATKSPPQWSEPITMVPCRK